MRTVDVTFQNLDSSEISLTDVSHYFDSDPTKLVAGLRGDGRTPSSYIADTTTANAQARARGSFPHQPHVTHSYAFAGCIVHCIPHLRTRMQVVSSLHMNSTMCTRYLSACGVQHMLRRYLQPASTHCARPQS